MERKKQTISILIQSVLWILIAK